MKRLMVFILIMLLMSFPGPVGAGGEKPAPPQSHAFGQTLSQWMLLYWTSVLSGEQDGQVRNVPFSRCQRCNPLTIRIFSSVNSM